MTIRLITDFTNKNMKKTSKGRRKTVNAVSYPDKLAFKSKQNKSIFRYTKTKGFAICTERNTKDNNSARRKVNPQENNSEYRCSQNVKLTTVYILLKCFFKK